jgi:hypothetical protein
VIEARLKIDTYSSNPNTLLLPAQTATIPLYYMTFSSIHYALKTDLSHSTTPPLNTMTHGMNILNFTFLNPKKMTIRHRRIRMTAIQPRKAIKNTNRPQHLITHISPVRNYDSVWELSGTVAAGQSAQNEFPAFDAVAGWTPGDYHTGVVETVEIRVSYCLDCCAALALRWWDRGPVFQRWIVNVTRDAEFQNLHISIVTYT